MAFDYKRAFCYQWKEEVKTSFLKTETVWRAKAYDVVVHHDMFVSMGVIGSVD